MLKLAWVCLFLFLATFQKSSAQIDTNAVFRIFNVTFESGGVTMISNTRVETHENAAAAESNQMGANTVPVENACSFTGSELPCDPNANCTDVNATLGIIQCTCPSGYNQTASTMVFSTPGGVALIPDGTNCPDIDECEGNTTVCGSATDQCFNTDGSYSCNCTSGYEYDSGNRLCVDIDECNNSTLNDCHQNATCSNTDGSFSCQCNSGFSGDGVNCTEIDECMERNITCGGNGECVDPIGETYSCNCSTGYEENANVDPRTCENVDECATNMDTCDNNADCTDTNGSFTCSCRTGYTGDGMTCSDIDECTTNNPCDGNATCMNTDGSFTCTCNDGFTGNGTSCQASSLNFCYRLSITFDQETSGDTSSRANDAESAVNDTLDELTNGNVGFSYATFSYTFEAVQGNNTITEFIVELCLNESSQTPDQFTATLRDFTFTSIVNGSVITVLEYNECLTNYGNCSTNADCTNTNGSFSCTCFSTYSDQSMDGMNGTICELPTNFTCSSNTVNVTAYNPYFENLGINYTDLYLGSCPGTLDGDVILYFGECDPVIESNDTYISYKWNLTNVNESAEISVGNFVTIPITCTFLSSQNVSFNITSERRNILFGDDLNNRPGEAYEFVAVPFLNRDTTRELNEAVNTNTPIFFRVGTQNALPANVRMQVQTCTTTAADRSSISLRLIENGCPVPVTNTNRRVLDTLRIVRNGNASTALIAVNSHFFGQSRITMATFEVNACVESGGASSCEYNCGARRKRHVITSRVKRQNDQSGEVAVAIVRRQGDSCNTDCGEGGICAFDETSGESTTDTQICVCADGYENENGGSCTQPIPVESLPVLIPILIAIAGFLFIVVVLLVLFIILCRRNRNPKEQQKTGYINTSAIDNTRYE